MNNKAIKTLISLINRYTKSIFTTFFTSVSLFASLNAIKVLNLAVNDLGNLSPLFNLTTLNDLNLRNNFNISCSEVSTLEADLGAGVVNQNTCN